MGQPTPNEELFAEEPTSVAPPTSTPSRRRLRVSAQDRARRRQQGIVGHLSTLLLQPRLFFATLPQTRHWLIVVVLAFVIVGYSAVTPTAPGGDSTIPDPNLPIDGGFGEVPFDAGFDPSFEIPVDDPFAVPLPDDPSLGGGEGGEADTAGDVNSRVAVVVVACAWMVGAWLLQAVLLSVVPLLNGTRTSFARAFQIAVWASVPLLVLIVVQMMFQAIGGSGNAAGLSALIPRWTDYATLSPEVQWLVTSALTQTTVFSLYSLLLLWFGARDALAGRWLVCVLVVLGWVLIAVLIPVLTGGMAIPVAGGIS